MKQQRTGQYRARQALNLKKKELQQDLFKRHISKKNSAKCDKENNNEA